MDEKTKIIGDNIEVVKKKRFVLRNLSQKQRNALITGGAALGGVGLASLLANSFTFPDNSPTPPNPDPILNQDIDNDGILNDVDDDIDGDGILNASDTDMDGDGIENSSDDDIDGDGILNKDDAHTPDYENSGPPVVIYTEAPFSDLELDDIPFGKAFAEARSDIGPGGFFEWRGDVYNTYQKEEWETLSPDEQNDFMQSVVENSHFNDAEELDEEEIVEIIDDIDGNELVDQEDADEIINSDDANQENEDIVVDEIDDHDDPYDHDDDDDPYDDDYDDDPYDHDDSDISDMDLDSLV